VKRVLTIFEAVETVILVVTPEIAALKAMHALLEYLSEAGTIGLKSTFVLNNPAYAAGTVLVAGPDFGTGSSREHAVWALMNYGFRVVISSRFADIFRGNSGKAGLLTAIVAQDDVELIWKYLDNDPGAEVTVDLVGRTVVAGEIVAPFRVDDYTRWRLLEGLDDIGLTLRHEADVTAFEQHRPAWKPTTERLDTPNARVVETNSHSSV